MTYIKKCRIYALFILTYHYIIIILYYKKENDDIIRLISARKATKTESKYYGG